MKPILRLFILVLTVVHLQTLDSSCPWAQAPDQTPTPTLTPSPTPTLPFINVSLPRGGTIRLVLVPGGTFLMGSPADEAGRDKDEGPQRPVHVSSFWMSETEITQGQWQGLMGSNPASGHGMGSNYPVYYVSWNDITGNDAEGNDGFLEKLNTLGKGVFRLPTEAEWEYACRAGSQAAFCFGDGGCVNGCDPNCLASQYMWFCGNNSPNLAKAVHQKKPNAFGLYDMHGNVREWCHDPYEGDFIEGMEQSSKTVGDNLILRCVRGGAWFQTLKGVRSANRYWYNPGYRLGWIGFRIASSYIGTIPAQTQTPTPTSIPTTTPTPLLQPSGRAGSLFLKARSWNPHPSGKGVGCRAILDVLRSWSETVKH